MLASATKKPNLAVSIAKTGLLAGTLDAIAAIVWSYCYTQVISLKLFAFIAKGIFGKAAFTGGNKMIVYGILIHYFIAFAFTIAFYLLYPLVKSLLKNKYIIGIIYGIVIWLIMNLMVLPLTGMYNSGLNASDVAIGSIILVICVGLPIALTADSYYYKLKGRLLYL